MKNEYEVIKNFKCSVNIRLVIYDDVDDIIVKLTYKRLAALKYNNLVVASK